MLKIISTVSIFFLIGMLTACTGGSDKTGGTSESVTTDDPQTTNAPPVINPIADQTILFGDTAILSATAIDDGLPNATLTPLWRYVSGPANAGAPTFDRTDAMEVLVSFSAPGVYQLSISVDDGEFSVRSSMQVDVQAYATTSFNNGLEVSLPANYLPSHSYNADWINQIWQGVADCMASDRSWDQPTAAQRRTQLSRINVYKEQDYDPDLHDNTGDPDTWTSISVVAKDVMPSEAGEQGSVLTEKMVDYLLLFGTRPVDGSLICGYNHAGRRHATDTIVASVKPQTTTQNLTIDGIDLVVQARELKSLTMNQLVHIAE